MLTTVFVTHWNNLFGYKSVSYEPYSDDIVLAINNIRLSRLYKVTLPKKFPVMTRTVPNLQMTVSNSDKSNSFIDRPLEGPVPTLRGLTPDPANKPVENSFVISSVTNNPSTPVQAPANEPVSSPLERAVSRRNRPPELSMTLQLEAVSQAIENPLANENTNTLGQEGLDLVQDIQHVDLAIKATSSSIESPLVAKYVKSLENVGIDEDTQPVDLPNEIESSSIASRRGQANVFIDDSLNDCEAVEVEVETLTSDSVVQVEVNEVPESDNQVNDRDLTAADIDEIPESIPVENEISESITSIPETQLSESLKSLPTEEVVPAFLNPQLSEIPESHVTVEATQESSGSIGDRSLNVTEDSASPASDELNDDQSVTVLPSHQSHSAESSGAFLISPITSNEEHHHANRMERTERTRGRNEPVIQLSRASQPVLSVSDFQQMMNGSEYAEGFRRRKRKRTPKRAGSKRRRIDREMESTNSTPCSSLSPGLEDDVILVDNNIRHLAVKMVSEELVSPPLSQEELQSESTQLIEVETVKAIEVEPEERVSLTKTLTTRLISKELGSKTDQAPDSSPVELDRNSVNKEVQTHDIQPLVIPYGRKLLDLLSFNGNNLEDDFEGMTKEECFTLETRLMAMLMRTRNATLEME